MSQAQAKAARRKAVNGNRHLAKLGRVEYKYGGRKMRTVAEAIAAARRTAAREAAARSKKK